MTEVRDVTGTAFVVAEFRAVRTPRPIRSTLIRSFPSFSMRERSRRRTRFRGFPAAETNVRLRTRYLDDRLDEQLARGCRQVVILGAGLDTRAVRKRFPGVAYFEIDDANTLSFKEARLAENGMPPRLPSSPAIMSPTACSACLRRTASNASCRVFSLGGQHESSTKGSVMQVLAELKGNVRAFGLSFDYMDKAVVARATGDRHVRSSSSASRRWARPGILASMICRLWRQTRA